jgi:hypothetical protein
MKTTILKSIIEKLPDPKDAINMRYEFPIIQMDASYKVLIFVIIENIDLELEWHLESYK